MDPRPRVCLMENVPGLQDKHETTGRSSFDAVKAVFDEMGFAFTSKVFDAQQTGIPNTRQRLYMTAIAGMAADATTGFTERVHASLEAQLARVTHRPLGDFLLDEYAPEDMINDWMPELLVEKRKSARPAAKHIVCMEQKWAACPHLQDKGLYMQRLEGNPWYRALRHREQDILLFHLCHHQYPGPQTGVVTLHTSAQFSRLVQNAVPTQVPNARFWLLERGRLQTGAEALMLQGVDLVDIPSFGIGSYSSSLLQDLAGNAFCVYQFVVWLLACLPEVSPRVT
jgi:site-specific DNA-cytosine methylase